MKILAVCGSLQRSSGNLTLLQRAAELAPEGMEIVLYDGLRNLPHFDPDLEADGPLAEVAAWRRALARSDGLLIACPEYGHSLPGALKNGIDWVIGSGELERKVVAITALVRALPRGELGLLALHQTLNAVRARIVGGTAIARGEYFERDLKQLLAELCAEVARPDRAPEPEFF